MSLNLEQLGQLADWLTRVRPAWPACPNCGKHDWNAYADLQAVALAPGALCRGLWTSTAMVRIGCGQCAYAVLVPAETVGVLALAP